MSEIKVNKISPRTACGTTTLGDSGDTFTIPAGVSITNSGTASGFGATGAVSWNTTVKTSGFTAVAGEGYFVNTTGGAVSVNLPAGTAGAVVGFKDYAGTFDTNAVTLVQNGSDKIGGSTDNANLATEGIAVTLVFIDSTQGWLVTDSGLQSEAPGPLFVTATGGTITTDGNFKIHTFTGPGTFTVTSTGNAGGSNVLDYLVAGGGGGSAGGDGNNCARGGSGAGGFRYSAVTYTSPSCAPGHPLRSTSGITAAAQAYPVTVGGGGAAGAGNNPSTGVSNGANSVFSTITSAGGGYGADANGAGGQPGGSGGGSTIASSAGGGNTPPVSPPQGQNGGTGYNSPPYAAGGGGGAIAVGGNSPPTAGGVGGAGAGLPTAFGSNGVPSGSFRYYSGGGGGGRGYSPSANGAGGLGGGGAGGDSPLQGTAGTANTGGGAGGTGQQAGGAPTGGATGGSGIVVIRYKFQ